MSLCLLGLKGARKAARCSPRTGDLLPLVHVRRRLTDCNRPASAMKPGHYAGHWQIRSAALVTNIAPRRIAALVMAAFLASCGSPSPDSTPSQTPAPSGSGTAAAEQFAAVAEPTTTPPRVYGAYTRGCIAGARQLPTEAPHWQVLNPSRNRAWGHPALIRFIESLAGGVANDGHRGLLIGDLAQPRGGPLPSDHNSHQIGLDADIWLTPIPPERLASGELETFEPPTMVDAEAMAVLPHRFGDAQVAMIKRAAMAPEVERIFVSPPIKQALCNRTPASDRGWLAKVRPWRGHTAHMHVRLGCPIDSDECKAQEPVPDGDGCGEELASWFAERSWTKRGTTPYKPETAIRLDALPAECRKLLAG
jgi:penicillin-insensitive murein DD-endopeptidase